MSYKFLETNRLSFRQFNENDLAFLIRLLSDDLVCKYLPGNGGYSLEICEKYLLYFMMAFNQKNLNMIYLVSRIEDNTPIGYCGIQMVNEFTKYEIFYAFIPECWNKGYASEASLRMKELAKNVGITEMIGLAEINNYASQRVLEKTGFTKIKQIPLWGMNLFYYEMDI